VLTAVVSSAIQGYHSQIASVAGQVLEQYKQLFGKHVKKKLKKHSGSVSSIVSYCLCVCVCFSVLW